MQARSAIKLGIFISLCLMAISAHALTITAELSRAAQQMPRQKKMCGAIHCHTYHQTTKFTCGPAAVMTMLNYYGKLSTAEMNTETEMRIAEEMGAKNSGTSQRQVAVWLERHGFRVVTGDAVTSKLIMDNLNRGIPTLVGLHNHWVLAKGYHEAGADTYKNKNEIIFADSSRGTHLVDEETIDST